MRLNYAHALRARLAHAREERGAVLGGLKVIPCGRGGRPNLINTGPPIAITVELPSFTRWGSYV